RIVPSVGSVRRRMSRDTVDLPHPDSPTRASVSRSASEKLTPSTARTEPPKIFLTSVTSSSLFIGSAPCPAGHPLMGRHGFELRDKTITFGTPLRATRMERTTGRHVRDMRHGAANGRQTVLLLHLDRRCGVEQAD